MLHVSLLAAMMSLGAAMTLFMARVSMVGRYGASSAALGLFFGLTTVSAGCLLATLLWPDTALQPWRAVIGAGSLPALYLHFALGSDPDRRPDPAILRHLVPMLAVAVSVLTGAFWAIDPILFVTYGVYLWALTGLLRKGARHFRDLGPHLGTTLIWLRIVIGVICASLILEMEIFTDLARGGAFEASLPLLLSTALFFGLVSYALLGAMGRPSLFEHVYNMLAERAPPRDGADDKPQPEPDDHALFARLDAFLDDPEILADDSLTLSRVSRRLSVPARSVSVAVNRVAGQSFSDLLNDRRITLAARLIDEDHKRPLLDIMYAAGFGAKSNFYKQFKRRMGITPAAFRAQGVAGRRTRRQEACLGQKGTPRQDFD
ncbi:helix-turn-helix domain-containing protein [Antarctobacter heliothermus]|uniref:AraC-type DNA-binding protein n=1 Tax=Antarctobacter heliothermus TaxID=74033 RepID=A0A239H8I8_9RHOB|nr:helix-turn-helix domain-containing protein [Antarctobacter heliothermus]SNS77491.1 AraC-type DNA-binding protein [Antarctobacter heliothermus]